MTKINWDAATSDGEKAVLPFLEPRNRFALLPREVAEDVARVQRCDPLQWAMACKSRVDSAIATADAERDAQELFEIHSGRTIEHVHLTREDFGQ